jgi:preprotein translocase SecE subunit
VARNRQRNRTPRPDTRLDPLFPQGGGAGRPPVEDDVTTAFADADDDDASGASAEDASAASAAFGRAQPDELRSPSGNRVFGFLRASWAELQRVQWPDRQQVAQATGVVLGFVVITGIFLGVADYLAGKLINFII